jgi:hypothetical protein
MTNWLPEEEGAQLRFEFETELVRLEAACDAVEMPRTRLPRCRCRNSLRHSASRTREDRLTLFRLEWAMALALQ